jgi:heme/copper-type cytochrome/quinol oxidase subunit 2
MILTFIFNLFSFGLYSQFLKRLVPMGFQHPNSISFNNIIDFHDYIIIFLVFIFIIVIWHLFWACNLSILFIYFALVYNVYCSVIHLVSSNLTKFQSLNVLKFLSQDLTPPKIKSIVDFIQLNCNLSFIREDYIWSFLHEIIRFNTKRNFNFVYLFAYELALSFFFTILFLGFLNKNWFSSKLQFFVRHIELLVLQQQVKKDKLETKKLTHAPGLEIFWTIFPSFILLAIAIPSLILLYQLDAVEPLSLCVKVIGHQWYWTYEIGSSVGLFQDFLPGRKVIYQTYFDSYMIADELSRLRLLEVDNPLFVPTGIPLTFLITSTDVIHSWAVPSLGIKVDAIPGRLNQVGVTVLNEGIFYGQCSELCGVNHGFMPINVIAY